MMAEFRALCAELLDELDYQTNWSTAEDLKARAHAALADEPAAPAPPADGEVAELVVWLRMQGEAQKPGPESLLSTKTKKEMHANGVRLTRAAELLQRQALVPVAVPGEEYHDDMGAVTWWRLPVDEPPWIGTPNDSDWPGYHTHFTPAPPVPANANALPLPEAQP